MRLTIVGLFLVFLAGTGLADSVLTGNWIGTVNITEKQIPVRVHFNVAQRTTNGTITLPMDRIYDQPLSAVSVKSGSVHFELKIGDLVQTFDGKIQNRQMQGNFTMGEAKGNFELLQLATVDPKTTSRYYGMYQLEPNRFLYIRTWDELGDNRLTYFDNTGNIGALLPSSKTDFFWGPSCSFLLP